MTYIIDDLARVRMLASGVYTMASTAAPYCFTLMAVLLRKKYRLSQSEIATISTVGNCIGYCSFPIGALFDYAGPMVLLPLGGFLGSLGFLLFGLTFDGKIANPTLTLFCVFDAIVYSGIPTLDVATIMPAILQFPLDRGYVVLVLKTISGLGTGVLMAYFNGWFKDTTSDDVEKNNYSGFMYFIAARLLIVSLIVLSVTRMPMYFPCAWRKQRLSEEEWTKRQQTLQLYMNQPAPPRRMKTAVGLVLSLLLFLTTQSLIGGYVKLPPAAYLAFSIIAVLMMASFCVVALPFQWLGRYTPVRPTDMDTIGEALEDVVTESAVATTKNEVKPLPQYSGSFWQHLLTVDLWCMWLTCFGVWGTGTVMQMNAAQIYESKSYGEKKSSTLTLYITMMSVGSAVGRMSMGFTDMVLTRRQREGLKTFPTTIALPFGPLMLCIAFLLFALLPANALILPFFLGALGNGAGWGSGVLAFRIMYSQDLGKHYNFGFSSGVAATIALNLFMFGGMYDAEAERLDTKPECKNPSCVKNQMLILMGANIVAVIAAAIVHFRFSRFINAEQNRCNEPADEMSGVAAPVTEDAGQPNEGGSHSGGAAQQ
ncbi:hypothetical protein, conserved [Trypanosoma brucei gambiense DAL972]|uniref:Nodulin-like domain-containing protein n=1 Tax=Trypanosoma brucei gambiense (strain MHOM/CI/86/DAL972) TaxID=679716 RepID=C9ZLA1_TRYB9|nr:hypothetical protein, conserved [Trypanosoma brucei gambiense DAL972]CBH10110.1 hypothetical protein, conserved [Trypanosoma brucei gambiense DAL972]|eukprot:XP_011772400.1 hypothetical protein, conserved [Trypanosoma brucei gambiense DAL972]